MSYILWQRYDSSSLSVKATTELEHRMGRELLRMGLRRFFGRTYPDEEWEQAVRIEPVTGKPYLEDHFAEFNITHTGGLAACAFDRVPVGLDSEKIGYFPEILIKKALTDSEKQLLWEKGTTDGEREEWFYRLWTLKEAYGKRTGQGVAGDLKAVSFRFSGENDPYGIACTDEGVSMRQYRITDEHILSVCTEQGSIIKQKDEICAVHEGNILL